MEVVELLICDPEQRLERVVFHCEEEDDGGLRVCLWGDVVSFHANRRGEGSGG